MELKREHLVVLVDENDREVGTYPKLLAHTEGKLHRAVSVFVFDRNSRLLLQRRARGKYHSGGLCSNTCCTHPHPGETPAAAAERRLKQEMGFDCALQPAGSIVYRAALDKGLIEHEYDHLFAGRFDGIPRPDPAEVADWRWIPKDELAVHREKRPGDYTAWFWTAWDHVRQFVGLNSSLT